METPENSLPAITVPHGSVKPFRVSRVSVAKIEKAGGMEYVCRAVLEGHTHALVAQTLDIPRSDLGAWVHNQNDPAYHRAMAASGDSLLDRAEDVLRQAKGGSMADVQIAREIAGLYIRRAGIRNVLFKDKLSQSAAVALMTPQAPAEIPRFYITIAPALASAPDGRIIEQEE